MTQTNKADSTRQERGKLIAEKGGQINRVSPYSYEVRSQSGKQVYSVIHTESGWNCTCADHTYRQVCCKHIHAVEISVSMREQVRKQNSTTISPVNINSCIYCKSQSITKDGLRHNKYGDIQKFNCKSCNRYFTINIGFEKMKHNPKGITMAMQLYFSGESLRNVSKSLKLLGMDVTHQTVYNWIQKYTKLMQTYLDRIIPQTGDVWRADEVFVKIRGDLKYVFALMDDETRFWIAQEVADRKEGHDARNLFAKGKVVTQDKPRVLVTDGLGSYHEAYLKEFWTQNPETRTTHIKHIRLQGDMNNNKMERLNGEFRDREKVMRGLKKTDSSMISGYQMFHNYIRPHMSLDGKTPAEACGIKIEGDNKWITVIQNASKS